MIYFCTYFDSNYLTRGLALYDSLRRNCPKPFLLWILCFDDETYRILRKVDLPYVRLISIQEFEQTDQDLLRVKNGRSRVEYYWTCTPSLPLYVFRHNLDVKLIAYVDADLYLFDSPQPIYDELGSGSIAILEHRYAPEQAHQAANSGIFNVSVMVFRRDQRAFVCLNWWRERCLEWCYARVENGKFGDQKYLDDWTTRFDGVAVVQHKGAGLAPWNIANYSVTRRNGKVWVDDQPLIFYHFHGVRQYSSLAYTATPSYKMADGSKRMIYERYVNALNGARSSVRRVSPNYEPPFDDISRLSLRGVLEGQIDLVGTTRYLPIVRKVYHTVQRLYRVLRYRKLGERTNI